MPERDRLDQGQAEVGSPDENWKEAVKLFQSIADADGDAVNSQCLTMPLPLGKTSLRINGGAANPDGKLEVMVVDFYVGARHSQQTVLRMEWEGDEISDIKKDISK